MKKSACRAESAESVSRLIRFCLIAGVSGCTASEVLYVQKAAAQTFNERFLGTLDTICKNKFRGGLPVPKSGTPLVGVCNASNTSGANPTSATGNAGVAGVSTTMPILRRFEHDETNGASADTIISLSPGMSIFVSPEYERLTHRNNQYEDGYSSNNGRITFGGDYQISEAFLAGLAFNYSYNAGSFDDSGDDFYSQGFGPIVMPSSRHSAMHSRR